MMMNSYKYLAVSLLLVSTINGHTIEDIDNSITTSNNNNEKLSGWLSITLAAPPKIIQRPGESVELECELLCEVIGKQHPTIHWIGGNDPHNIIILDSNVISEINEKTMMVGIRSRLIIENSSASERTFTCVASANGKTKFRSTTIFSAPGHNPQNVAELSSMNSGAEKARIVLYYSQLFDTLGSDIMLPCKAASRPNTEIYWLDNKDKIISEQNPRFRVHSSGSLYISPLIWEDMGEYICVAKNAISEDSISTFIYPILKEE